MITKGQIKSINRAGNKCIVRLPLFETASSPYPIEIEALINITPGFFNNLFVGDVVFVTFEENALEKPIIMGKLYTGTTKETKTHGGAGVLDTLTVRTSAALPSTTNFIFSTSKDTNQAKEYENLNTPKKLADYVKWLEGYCKSLISVVDTNFSNFKSWVQWKFSPENIEVDDGDLDKASGTTSKEPASSYSKPDTTKAYPEK